MSNKEVKNSNDTYEARLKKDMYEFYKKSGMSKENIKKCKDFSNCESKDLHFYVKDIKMYPNQKNDKI